MEALRAAQGLPLGHRSVPEASSGRDLNQRARLPFCGWISM